jgi:hypothetical protein
MASGEFSLASSRTSPVADWPGLSISNCKSHGLHLQFEVLQVLVARVDRRAGVLDVFKFGGGVRDCTASDVPMTNLSVSPKPAANRIGHARTCRMFR